MKKQYLALALAAAIGAASATAAFAHHSFSMFNPDVEIVLKGKVARWAFTSPHTFMMLQTEDGKVWAFEGSAPPGLLTRNPSMKGDTFKEGDEITVVMCPLRDGRNGGASGLFITADGTVYNPADAGCRANQRAAEWPTWIEKGYMSLEEAKKGEGIQ
ncbi:MULTISPECIES: DUF6152 family protein [Devosia]|uniref:Uncharacterized protein n=1 Tax=Devosia equisanguinis TaxID=2490941 RepID=A0A447I8U2_9HYPH|nr:MULTISPECIES: DUF6152 family protein [Devosia]ODT47997.1 MAG: hypothetical protein ABS74_17525 [Pelagibacterium sp. SCN 63-126]ODU82570.1 MAG: hypothetical protein ABT14_16595 [Pelagibacterium sp. SCN 63-17]OJX42295.1 MAG: hypothetical protein BGO80_12325 [Devosia sp. 63-57]VDS03834.1 hypothetical protein DEVEQU_00963 [Devosia equisanguinis]